MKTDLGRLLIQKGYAPIKVRDRAVQAAALRALGVLGPASVKALLFHMCALTSMQEKDLLANYREFEKALWNILGSGADILLKRFNDDLARNVPAGDLGLNKILDTMRKDEPFVFARNMDYGENAALLYRSESFRDRVVSGFFDPVSAADEAGAAVFAKMPALPPSVARTTYEQLQDERESMPIGERVARWAFSLRKGGRYLRLAKDDTWLAEMGLEEEPHDGSSAPWQDAAVLCTYDAGRIGADKTIRIIESHNVIMFEDSQAVYSRR
jgi:hypothetical protein